MSEMAEHEIPSSASAEIKRYVFDLGLTGQLCSFAPGIGTEIAWGTKIFAVPNAKSWLLGVINFRGAVLPVLDLSQLEAVSAAAQNVPMILCVDKGEQMLAFAMYSEPSLLPVQSAAADMDALVGDLSNNVSTWLTCDRGLVVELDHQGIAKTLAARNSLS
jgi:chemotaxis signal transduction protein